MEFLAFSLLIFKTWFTIIRSSKKRKKKYYIFFQVVIRSLKDLPSLRCFDSSVSDQEVIYISPRAITLKSKLFSVILDPSQSSFKSCVQSHPFSFLLSTLFSFSRPFLMMLYFVTWLCSQCFLSSFMPMENIILPLAQDLFLYETIASSCGRINFYLNCPLHVNVYHSLYCPEISMFLYVFLNCEDLKTGNSFTTC